MRRVTIDDCDPSVTFEVRRLVQPSEPEDHILWIDGRIILERDEDSEVTVGKIQVLRVLIEQAREAGCETFEVLDSLTDTEPYIELIDERGAWCEGVQEQFVDLFEPDLLVINKVEVDPKYRGQGLGVLAVRAVIDCFSEGCALIAMKPFPLQFNHWEAPDWKPEVPLPAGMTKERAFSAALRKVQAHWARLGFQRIGETELWGLCPAHRLPSLDAALKGIAGKAALKPNVAGPRNIKDGRA